MILPVLVLAALSANLLLFLWLRRRLLRPGAWLTIAAVAIAVASVRAIAVGGGALLLASDSIWMQIPAYLLVNLGLPEIVLSGRQSPADPASWYWRAMGIVALGSVLWVFTVAGLARVANRASTPPRRPAIDRTDDRR